MIGRPVKSRSGGQWIITASRRFNHSDGSFAGVVLTSVDVGYFIQFYRRFDIGPNGAVSLLNADGTMLARSRDDEGAYVGRDMSGSPLFRTMGQRPDTGAYYFKSPLDGQERLSFYQKSGRYPLVVLATKAQSDVRDALTHLLLALDRARPVVVAVAEKRAVLRGRELYLGSIKSLACAELRLLSHCKLARQPRQLHRRNAAGPGERGCALHGRAGLLASCGSGLDRGLYFGDTRLKLQYAPLLELGRLPSEILLSRLRSSELGRKARSLVLQSRHLPAKIVQAGAIAARIDDAQDRRARRELTVRRRGKREDLTVDRRAQCYQTRVENGFDARRLQHGTERNPAEHSDKAQTGCDLQESAQMARE